MLPVKVPFPPNCIFSRSLTAMHDYFTESLHHIHKQVFTVTDTNFSTWRKNMHQREITSMLFFNPLKYLITGSHDGSSMYHIVSQLSYQVAVSFFSQTKTLVRIYGIPAFKKQSWDYGFKVISGQCYLFVIETAPSFHRLC